MKRKTKKYFKGGNMLLPQEGATNSQAAGQFAQLQGLQNAGVDMVQNFGDSYLSDKGFDQGELDIINQDMGKNLSKIPGIGMAASVIKGGFNMLSGRTANRLKNYRMDKQKIATENLNYANDMSGYANQAQVTFANGGDLSMLEGPSHAEGGIQLTPEAEVEGGETKKANYIFSDRLIIPGKKTTFAQQSKKINKMYLGKRPNDPISDAAEKRELAVLQDMQEIVRGEIMSNAYTKAYGGFLKKKKMYAGGNMPGIDNDPMSKYENLYNQKMEKLMKFTPNTSDLGADIPADIYGPQDLSYAQFNPQTNINNIEDLPGYSQDINLNLVDAGLSSGTPASNLDVYQNPKFAFSQAAPDYFQTLPKKTPVETGGLQGGVQPMSIVQAPSITQDVGKSSDGNAFGMQPADYASIGTQALSGLSQLYYGLKGPDEVPDAKFRTARPNKINMTKAKRLASQEIDSSFNLTDDAIRTAAPTVASYLSNRLTSGIKRARTKAETNINLSQREEIENNNTQNNFNQFNAQVLNAEEQVNLGQADKRIQEKDAARMAVTEGLNNIGQSVGQGVRDKRAYDWQENLAGNWMGTNNFVMDEQGNRYFLNGEGKYIKMIKKKKQ